MFAIHTSCFVLVFVTLLRLCTEAVSPVTLPSTVFMSDLCGKWRQDELSYNVCFCVHNKLFVSRRSRLRDDFRLGLQLSLTKARFAITLVSAHARTYVLRNISSIFVWSKTNKWEATKRTIIFNRCLLLKKFAMLKIEM